MPTPSKMVLDRQKSAEKVIASARAHGDKVAQAFEAEFGSGAMASAVLKATTDRLEQRARELVMADDAHNRELSDDSAPRAERDRLSEELRAQLVQLRGLLEASFGSEYTRKLGFEGPTPDDPLTVQRWAEFAVTQTPKVPLPEVRIPGLKVEPRLWFEPLKENAVKLANALKAVALEEREAEQTLVAKRKAIEVYDRTFSNAASLTSVLLNIAGETELARRVRPSGRSPGRTVEDVGGDPELTPPAPLVEPSVDVEPSV